MVLKYYKLTSIKMNKQMSRINNTEYEGMAAAESVFRGFGWAFRPQPVQDIGVDAEVEYEEEGLIIKLQVKTGQSYLQTFDKATRKFTFYLDHVHYGYYTRFRIPILLVVHDNIEKKTYWQAIKHEHIQYEQEPNRPKLFIPEMNLLTASSKDQILDEILPAPIPKALLNPPIDGSGTMTLTGNPVMLGNEPRLLTEKLLQKTNDHLSAQLDAYAQILEGRFWLINGRFSFGTILHLTEGYLRLGEPNLAVIEISSYINTVKKEDQSEWPVGEKIAWSYANLVRELILSYRHDAVYPNRSIGFTICVSFPQLDSPENKPSAVTLKVDGFETRNETPDDLVCFYFPVRDDQIIRNDIGVVKIEPAIAEISPKIEAVLTVGGTPTNHRILIG